MDVTLDWLGVSTFRLRMGSLVVFLDAYMDRVPEAPPVGMGTADVREAHFILIGHSHFDHLWGAQRIARQTGAIIVGSYETIRIMAQCEVPEDQLMAVAGGERIRLSDKVTVRVFPSQHAYIWGKIGRTVDEECLGDIGLTLQERRANLARSEARLWRSQDPAMASIVKHRHETNPGDRGDGGALAYLLESPEGTLLWKDSAGHWTGILRDLRPDAALLGAAARGNIDGEPMQGTLAAFVAREAELLRPRRIVLCHHDNWMPPATRPTDVEPIRHELAKTLPWVKLIEMGYVEGYPILRQ